MRGDPASKSRRNMSTTASGNAKNILNSDVEITGTLKFNGELSFDGKLNGDIASEGTLHLGDNAVIKGNLNVNSVVLRGKINGNVTAKERIEIKAKTELFGDIRSAKLAIEEGVTFEGKTEVNPSKVAPLAAPQAPGGESARAAEPSKPGGA
jgi:cytoskeletal protein CcmA (bactofilin family)